MNNSAETLKNGSGKIDLYKVNSLSPAFRTIRKPFESFRREAMVTKSYPKLLQEGFEKIMPFLEKDPDQNTQQQLSRILSNPTAMDGIVDYFLLALQANIAYKRMEQNATDIIKETDKRKGRSKEHTSLIDGILDVLSEGSFSNPFDSLPEEIPTFQDLARVTRKQRDREINRANHSDVLDAFKKVSSIFSDTKDPEQVALMAFCTYIGIHQGIDPSRRESRAGIHDALTLVNDAAEVFTQFFQNVTLGSEASIFYGGLVSKQTRKEVQEFYTNNPTLPTAIAHFMLMYESEFMIPTSFRSLIDCNPIPMLDPLVATEVKHIFTRDFFRSETYAKKNFPVKENPYTLAERSYNSEGALSFLNELASQATEPKNIKNTLEELFYLRGRLRTFLGNRFVTIPKDQSHPKLLIESNKSILTVFAIADDNRCLAFQFHPQTFMLEVHGIPGDYATESQAVVGQLLQHVLENLAAQGYREYKAPFETSSAEEFLKKQLTSKPEVAATPSVEPTQEITLVQPEKQVLEQPVIDRKQRFSIAVPEKLLSIYDTAVQSAILAEIDEINFSKPGTYPMRKIAGSEKNHLHRARIRRIVRDEKGNKIPINLRALIRMDGTTGVVQRIFDRPEGYERQLRGLSG